MAVVNRGQLERLLRLATAGALVGHGGFGAAMAKPEWLGYLAAAGLPPSPRLASLVGALEIAVGLLVLLWPADGLLLALVAWKVGTELLRVLSGEPVWEFVERWSNYTAPLALLYVRRSGRTIGAIGSRPVARSRVPGGGCGASASGGAAA
jgi:hypothetical protein